MKFNFEKAKKIATKAAIGAGVVVAPIISSGQNNPNEATHKNIQNKEINKDDPELYRNEYIKYMEHPSYKERLTKEMYGDEDIDHEKQKIINNEYEGTLKQIKTIPIYMIPNMNESQDTSHYNIINNIIYTTTNAAPHELTHATQNFSNFKSREKGFEDIVNKIIKNREFDYVNFLKSKETDEYNKNILLFSVILKNYISENKNGIQLTVPIDYLDINQTSYDFVMNQLNELNIKNFSLKKYNRYIGYDDRVKLENNNQIKELKEKILNYLKKLEEFQDNYFYYYKNEEIKARITHLRFRAINEFKYNLNDTFDINKFDKIKEDKQYNDLKNHLKLSDEQINELMKYTADNGENNDNNGIYVHPNWNYNNGDNKA